jgi:hypothetical protein
MTGSATFVLVYGPPGIGKLAVATELSELTGAILFDNHVSIDWASSIFPQRASDSFRRLRDGFRELVLSEAARAGQDIVMTFVYAYPDDAERVERMFDAFEQNSGRVLPVRLTCNPAVHALRVQSPGRAERGKMTSPTRLAELMSELNLGEAIPRREGLTFDVTHRSARETARDIAASIKPT